MDTIFWKHVANGETFLGKSLDEDSIPKGAVRVSDKEFYSSQAKIDAVEDLYDKDAVHEKFDAAADKYAGTEFGRVQKFIGDKGLRFYRKAGLNGATIAGQIVKDQPLPVGSVEITAKEFRQLIHKH
jgi:hypothetical protein